MLATVAATDSASTVRKKYSVFIYNEAEPHAMYAIYKQTHTLCVLQYANFGHPDPKSGLRLWLHLSPYSTIHQIRLAHMGDTFFKIRYISKNI